MRWGDMRESQNVEDRSGMDGGGGGRGFPLGGGMRLGGGAIILLVIVGLLFGINPLEMLGLIGGGGPVQQAPQQQTAPPGYGPQQRAAPASPATPEKQLSKKVLGDTEDVWSAVFKAMGSRYDPPTLVLFSGRVSSACGMASAAVGPFYCPGDRKLYLDTAFFDELSRRFGAPGDFAQAYVIAHEVGHHVQNLFGTMRQFDAQSQRMNERSRNAMSVRLELQADCYAGVWGFFAQKRNLLEPGDLEEGMRAAAAVGDDQIQKRTQGYVVPEGFTHGSAQQRMRWFKVGMDSGDPRNCNTFEARQL
ncbi:MAG TPA: neutral zinc metallopeptidase [Casimicrobiaceae bacterium]|nr:neutral zinc metallopeptidase [Casimicrobiaceae bacterium]